MTHIDKAAAAAVAAALALAVQAQTIQDYVALHGATERLLHGGLGAVYSDAGFLEGPLTLIVGLILYPFGDAGATLLTVAVGLALWPLLILAERVARRPLPRPVVAVTVVPWVSLSCSGHADDVAAVGLALAACLALPGVWLAVGAAFKPWAVAGVGAIRSWRSACVFGVASLALWLPVLLSHPVTDGETIPVQPNAPLYLLTPGVLPGWVRTAQLLTVMVVGFAVSRRHGAAVGLVAAMAVRIMLEPGDFDYYFGTLIVAAAATGTRRVPLLVLAAYSAKFLPLQPAPRLALLLLVVGGALTPQLHLPARRRHSTLNTSMSYMGPSGVPLKM